MLDWTLPTPSLREKEDECDHCDHHFGDDGDELSNLRLRIRMTTNSLGKGLDTHCHINGDQKGKEALPSPPIPLLLH
jgi:hypothetical protein